MAICGVGRYGESKAGCGASIEWKQLVVDGELSRTHLAVNPTLVEPDGQTYMMFEDGTTGHRHHNPEMKGYILHRETCPLGIGQKKKKVAAGKKKRGHGNNQRIEGRRRF